MKRAIKRFLHVERHGRHYTFNLLGKKRKFHSNKLLMEECLRKIDALEEESLRKIDALEQMMEQQVIKQETARKREFAKASERNRETRHINRTLFREFYQYVDLFKQEVDSIDALLDDISKESEQRDQILGEALSALAEAHFAISERVNDKYDNMLLGIEQEIRSSADLVAKDRVDFAKELGAQFDLVLSDLLLLKAQLPNALVHFSAYEAVGNTGDTFLVSALRDSIRCTLDRQINFCHRPVRSSVSPEIIQAVNSSKGMLVGGGGLFLCDTNRNSISGWQFPVSINDIDSIRVPMIMLGVGYNRFRGQEEFDECFAENINAIISKCKFVGLRNTGSIKALETYLSEDNRRKLNYHPCATTILSKLYRMPSKEDLRPCVALNCAFDRADMRFGEAREEVLESIAKLMKELSKSYVIKYYVHMESDKQMCSYLDLAGVSYEIVDLSLGVSLDELLKAYSAPVLMFAMRGHAQLIPFGCGTPTVSIITHDKLKWFLEDIGHAEWGVDVLDADFAEHLRHAADYMLENQYAVREQIENSKLRLWATTQQNIKIAFSDVF